MPQAEHEVLLAAMSLITGGRQSAVPCDNFKSSTGTVQTRASYNNEFIDLFHLIKFTICRSPCREIYLRIKLVGSSNNPGVGSAHPKNFCLAL